jgi:hypothetical protein
MGRQGLICQLCGIIGHLVFWCHKRFKHEFLGIDNDGRNNDRPTAMGTQGYPLSYSIDPARYLDTSAMDHLANALGHLSI